MANLREWWYALLEPLARPFHGLDPNTISFLGLIAGLGAGASFAATGVTPRLYLLGAVLVIVSGVADCFDGIVARATGRTSAAGDFLDHVYDRVVDVAVLGGLALAPHGTTVLGLAATILALLNSYLGTQIVASFGRRHYGGIGKGQLFVLMILVTLALGLEPALAVTVAGRRLALLDLFFVLVGLGAVVAIVGRIRLGLRMARGGE